MRSDDLLRLLRQQPFQPLRIYLSSGITHEIHHPELALVGRSTLQLEMIAPGAAVALVAPVFIVSLVHIVQVELLRPPTSPSAN